ncbi:MAG: TonB-dependent receptor [Bergeyella sp.]
MNKLKYIAVLAFLGTVGISEMGAQIKEEKLILDKKREPEIRKIEKKKTSVATVKNYPPKEKKVQDSLNLKYNITDVPAVSDFKTSTIQGSDISPKFDNTYQDNYVRFGMGNFGRILADANISTVLESKMEVGADVHFNSTNGLKKLYDWKSKQTSADLGVFLNSYGEQGKFNINAEYSLNDYNYYGIYAFTPDSDIDINQKTNEIKINGYYDFYSNEILNDVRVKASFLSDVFDASENKASAVLNLSKHAVDITDDIVLNGDLGLGIETQSTAFDILNKNSSSFFNGNIAPKITFFKGESYLMIGSDFTFNSSKNNNSAMTEEEKTNKMYWFPRAELQIAAADEFKFYAGVDGGLKLNSYGEMLQENPYLVSDLILKPTETKYRFYIGLRGDIEQNLKYDFSAGFGKADNIMFYRGNGLFDDTLPFTSVRPGYDFANTFSAVYDNGSISEVKGSLQFFPLENLVLDGELNFTKYDVDNYEHIYNRPLLKANIGAKYTMLDKKLLLGFDGFFVSDRTTNAYSVSATMPFYLLEEKTDEKVGGYADINLSAEYKIHKNFSIFALGNNLLNSNYQTFNGYKVLGAQILGGVKITF